MEINVDLHIHGLYSFAVSPAMIPKTISEQSKFKGLDLVATADILNPKWEAMVKNEVTQEGDSFRCKNGSHFILSTEVEDARRVHHIIFFPDFSAVSEVRAKLSNHSKDILREGRPRVRLEAPEITDIVRDAGGDIGPAHAFTPWTSMYKEYDSIKECYGGKKIHFLELGLSADTGMADKIEELKDISYLSNSDCHSPWPNKLGREFNRMIVEEPSYPEVMKALKREGGRKITLNVGLDPRLGKYHESACIKCFTHFTTKEGIALNWRCDNCGNIIKKGVVDRINEVAGFRDSIAPDHRPKYLHVAPLAEIVALAHGIKSPYSKKVQRIWKDLVTDLGSEINVLIDTDLSDIKKIDQKTGELIKLFREGKIGIHTGGGGEYGHLTLDESTIVRKDQKKLGEWK